jgi:predicted aldo/keto reductase-like oxidoreductase
MAPRRNADPGKGGRVSRRTFIKVGVASLAAGQIARVSKAAASSEATVNLPEDDGLPKRKLGRTNIEVPIIGFGGAALYYGPRGPVPQTEIDAMMGYALDNGIALIDTSYGYGDGVNEISIGKALKGRRGKAIIFSKGPWGPMKPMKEMLETSLRRLQTDHIEIYGLHGLELTEDLAEKFIIKHLPDLVKAKEAGKISHIAGTGHLATTAMMKFVQTGAIDVIAVPMNPVRREFLEEVVPAANKMNIGVIGMKVFHFGKLSRPAPELAEMLGKDKEEFIRRTLSFSLGQDVASVIPGFTTLDEVKSAIAIGKSFKGFTSSESAAMRIGKEKRAVDFCRICGHCLPCPAKIAISDILRLELNARHYGLVAWAKQQYARQKVNADACTKCGECTKKCPHGLPAMDMVLRAAVTLA